MGQFSGWLDELGPDRVVTVKLRLVKAIEPVMRPYRPILVFFSGVVPAR